MQPFITSTILRAGEAIMFHFGKASVLHSKQTEVDIVTQADLDSQEILANAIKAAYPEHGIVSEESDGHQTDAEWVWYIDPLDGTKNFASGVQLFGINVALAQNGVIKYAAIYLPALNELCYAEAGKGTFVNDVKVECSQKKEWNNTYGLGPVKYSTQWIKLLELQFAASNKTGWVNTIASPAVCAVWIASGRRDWYIGPSKNSWDYAAPCLIAQEAGCVVSNFAGEPWKPGDQGLILTNKELFPKLLEMVKESYVN